MPMFKKHLFFTFSTNSFFWLPKCLSVTLLENLAYLTRFTSKFHFFLTETTKKSCVSVYMKFHESIFNLYFIFSLLQILKICSFQSFYAVNICIFAKKKLRMYVHESSCLDEGILKVSKYFLQGWQSAKKSVDSDSGFFSGFLASLIRIPIFSQHKYLNFKIRKMLLEWQLQKISLNDKHLHEDFGIFNSLI